MEVSMIEQQETEPASQEVVETNTRERLVNAAVEVFLERGYGGTRVQDIARKAGFTSGALYVHFPSRSALLSEAIIREGKIILDSMTESLDSLETQASTPIQAMAAFATAPTTKFDRLLLDALALAAGSEEFRTELDGALHGFVDSIRSRVTASKARGSIDQSVDVEALCNLYVSWAFGSVVSKALGLSMSDPDGLADIGAKFRSSI